MKRARGIVNASQGAAKMGDPCFAIIVSFEAHLATPHFKAFDVASRDLTIQKIAKGGDLAEHVKAF